MDDVHVKWEKRDLHFFGSLASLWHEGNFSDLTLACQSKLFAVHKVVLVSASSYFRKIIENTNCSSPVIVITDFESDIVEKLIEFIYLGQTSVSMNQLKDFVSAGSRFCIKDFKDVQMPSVEDGDPLRPHIRFKFGKNANQDSNLEGKTGLSNRSQNSKDEDPLKLNTESESILDTTSQEETIGDNLSLDQLKSHGNKTISPDTHEQGNPEDESLTGDTENSSAHNKRKSAKENIPSLLSIHSLAKKARRRTSSNNSLSEANSDYSDSNDNLTIYGEDKEMASISATRLDLSPYHSFKEKLEETRNTTSLSDQLSPQNIDQNNAASSFTSTGVYPNLPTQFDSSIHEILKERFKEANPENQNAQNIASKSATGDSSRKPRFSLLPDYFSNQVQPLLQNNLEGRSQEDIGSMEDKLISEITNHITYHRLIEGKSIVSHCLLYQELGKELIQRYPNFNGNYLLKL